MRDWVPVAMPGAMVYLQQGISDWGSLAAFFAALQLAVRKRRTDGRGIWKMEGVEDPLVFRGFNYA